MQNMEAKRSLLVRMRLALSLSLSLSLSLFRQIKDYTKRTVALRSENSCVNVPPDIESLINEL
jgi:hypothetical protein